MMFFAGFISVWRRRSRYGRMEPTKGGAGLKELSPLERAVEYIEAHLNENIGLRDVAGEIGYSYYHMTRLFSSVLGESAGRYIQRRRLYQASGQLLRSGRSVIEIALDSGFASPEAFSRAFKAAFGSSPAEYRKAGLDLVVNAKRELSPGDVYHIANNISHTPEILTLKEMKIADVRGTTSLSQNRLPGLWEEFLRLRGERGRFASDEGYGICETQQTVYTQDGDVSFSVVAGGPVERFDGLPRPLVPKTLGPGRYAVFIHRGSFAKLFQTYQYIFGTWLPAAGEALDEREDFERYSRAVRAFDDPDNEVSIYIPIK